MADNKNRLLHNLEKIQGVITQTCVRHGRRAEEVELLPASKSQPAEAVAILHAAGCRRFGENYAQELFAKHDALTDLDIHWVFIGAVQSNKIRRIIEVASEIQTLASEKHARLANRAAEECGKSQFPVYVNVNVGGEASKSGIPLDEALALGKLIASSFPHLRLMGLMAIPPFSLSRDEQAAKTAYMELCTAARGVGEGRLSLGMSGDLEAAIAAGSTCVRIGTALFGPRPKKQA